MIKAPYNFVPLSEQVVFPEWSSQISHDIPFSDGLSGTVSLRLTAKSPIFVRNGYSQEEGKEKGGAYNSFSNIGGEKGKYFIPATTLKGAVRNILEIMSFSKLHLDTNAKIAEREWSNEKLYTLKKEQASLRCGWLKPVGDHYEIIDCGKPYRIAQTRIDEHLNTSEFQRNFSKAEGARLNLNKERELNGNKYDPKTAEFKYRLVENVASLDSLRNLRFSTDEEFATGEAPTRMMVSHDGKMRGTIVLTGQPDLWMWPRPKELTRGAGKFYEFIFKNPEPQYAATYQLSEEEYNQYKFIYSDSPDWKYANDKLLPTTGIPVFFRLDTTSGTKKIKDWGLAFLYKLPYNYTPYELLPESHHSKDPDMAECLFGYTDKNGSLKGRVQFTPLWSNNARSDRACTLALCGPKASYYPIYIDQRDEGKNGYMTGPYKTYNNGALKGWKRYVLRRNIWESRTNSDKIDTKIYPLAEGTIFEGKIVFHNLKPEEIGALLSALTFHGNENKALHQIGMAKPYGYGKVKLDITNVKLLAVGDEAGLPQNYRSYMAIFEKYMNKALGHPWSSYASIKELLTLVNKEISDNSSFNYMTLEMNGRNEFQQAKGGNNGKGQRYYLPYLTDILNQSTQVSYLQELYKKELEEINKQRDSHSLKLEEQLKEQARIEAERIAELQRIEEGKRAEAKRVAAKLKAEEEKRDVERAAQEKEKKRKQKAEAGLSILEELNLNNEPKVRDFKGFKRGVEDWLKAANLTTAPASEYPFIQTTLLRISQKPSRDENKKKLWSNRDSAYLRFVESVTSKEFTDSIFNEIKNRKSN